MFCVTVIYSQKDGGTFNFDYYTKKHVPLVCRLVDVVKVEVRKGAASLDGSAPSFVCICSHWINSPQEFQAAMAKHGAEIMGDIPNFTNMQPILQLDEVLT